MIKDFLISFVGIPEAEFANSAVQKIAYCSGTVLAMFLFIAFFLFLYVIFKRR